MDGEAFRRASIASKLSKLITDNPEYSVANLLHTLLREKNMRVQGEKDSYFMNDEDFLVALEDSAKQLKVKEVDG